MSEAQNNTQMVAQALGRLTSMYRNKPNIRNIVKAIISQKQELQNVLYQVYVGRRLATAILYAPPQTNSVLDAIGVLVGQPRLGLPDAQYQAILFLRVAVNHATGQTPNWGLYARILLKTAGGGVEYWEGTAALCLFVGDMSLPIAVVARVLGDALPNGVRGVFAYSTWPDGNDFEWCDANDPTHTGQGTWGDANDPSIGGLLVSCAEMIG